MLQEHQLKQIEQQGIMLIESERFLNMWYGLKDKHLLILDGKNGRLAIHKDSIQYLITELGDIYKNNIDGVL